MLKTIARTYREAFRGLPRPIWALAAVTLVNRAGTMVLPFLILYLTTERGLQAGEAGGLLGVYGFGAMAGAYLGGWLVDRVGALRVQGLSLLLTGLMFLLLGELDSTPAIAVALAVLALVGEAFRPASAAALAELSPPAVRLRAFALGRLAINTGMTLGPAVGGFLAVYDYKWLFRVDGATCLLASLLLWMTFRGQTNRTSASAEDDPGLGHTSPWRDRIFLGFLILTFLLACVFFQIFSTFPLTLREHYGLTEDRIGLVLALNTLLIVLFEMVLTHRIEHRNPLRVLALGALLTCLGFSLLPLGTSVWLALASVAVWTVGEMLAAPTSEGFVAGRAAPAARGRFMGAFILAWSVAFVVAPVVGTLIYSRLGLEALWFGCGAIGAVLPLGFLLLSARERSRRTA